MHILKSIYSGKVTLQDAEKEQENLAADLGRINQGPSKYKSFEKLSITEKVKDLYYPREEVVKMFNDYAKNMFKNIYEVKKDEGRKILTPNQMLKRLPIAPAQISAGNNSESLLNKIEQIVYSLYRSK